MQLLGISPRVAFDFFGGSGGVHSKPDDRLRTMHGLYIWQHVYITG